MRQILFRGKTVDTGEWVYGYLVENYSDSYIFTPEEINKGIDFCGYLDCCQMYEVDPKTVGQYIGERDKNGQDIFEGDIVTSWGLSGFVVEYVQNSCGFEPYSDSRENCGHCGGGEMYDVTEVIGNVHDNPELAKERYDD